MKYKGFKVEICKAHGVVGAVAYQRNRICFTCWGFKNEREALKWARRQVEDVFLGRVK